MTIESNREHKDFSHLYDSQRFLVDAISTKNELTDGSFSRLITQERVLQSVDGFYSSVREQIHFWYARAGGRNRCRENESEKNQGNRKCIRRWVGKSRNKRYVRKFENFSSHGRRSVRVVLYFFGSGYFPLDYRGNWFIRCISVWLRGELRPFATTRFASLRANE